MPQDDKTRPAAPSPRALSGLLPFLRPYRSRVALALLFLVLAAGATLAIPVALKQLIDQGLVAADPGQRIMALRGQFLALFAVGAALGLFSAARFYMVSWLGERITADLRNAVYRHVVRQSPEFFETTRTGEVISRLTTDTTLVQTVVGSSLSLGLRNTVMGVGSLAALVVTNPLVMAQVLGILVLEFRTFKSTIIVLSVIPLGIIGALVTLFLIGETLSFVATIGMIALVGIEIKNSILLVDYTNQLREQGMPLEQAIMEGAETRFLPILLTTMTAIGGLIPLVLENSPLISPLAWVLIGGLISSTLLSRIVTPLLYKLLPPKVS